MVGMGIGESVAVQFMWELLHNWAEALPLNDSR